MFNFFSELKSKFKDVENKVAPYQCVMLGDFLLYVEGFVSLITYTSSIVVFKVKGGVITIEGKNMSIKEMSPSTITIGGEITQVSSL